MTLSSEALDDAFFPEFPADTGGVEAAPVDLDAPGWMSASLAPRHEDVNQNGRFVPTAIVPGLGVTLWSPLHRAMQGFEVFRVEGIVPILRRLVIATRPGPFSIHEPVRYRGTWRFAREIGGDRLFLNMYLEARAPIASTYGPRPDEGARDARVGRVFAEHVLTRPFAPADARKVTTLVGSAVPKHFHPHAFESAEDIVGDVGDRADDRRADFTFGLMHTDANQHVNSLVYPRIFEEMVVRALPSDEARTLVDVALEMRWRKPFFAGETADVAFRLERAPARIGGKVLATGVFGPRGAARGKPSCGVRLLLG